jgi:large subunit ribosomal protein L10
MPKTRLQKEELLQKLTDRLGRSQSVVFLSVEKVKVSEVEQLRDGFFKEGLQLQVAKNSLLKRVLSDMNIEVPAEVTDQPMSLVYSYEDAVLGPKTVQPFLKDMENLKILGGIADNKFISAAQVEAYAKLPSREQLLGQLVGTLQAPISGLVNVLAGNIRGLVTVLGAVRDTKTA